tara:strand:- start:173 stop:1726 length:1554 start_codon:yes stop_codon:yes gene_type:complete
MKYKSLQQVYGESVRGNVPPRKHLHVVNEAKVTIEYDEGETEQIELSDVNARELKDIAKVSTSRNPMIMKIDGKWVGSDRLTKKQLQDTYDEVQVMADMGTISEVIEKIANKATIFDEPVSSFNSTLRNIQQFLIDSAELTLEKNNKKVNARSRKGELVRILGIIASGKLQKSFVSYLDSKGDGTFNIWESMDPEKNDNKIYFALDTDVGRDLQVMRPASDLAATRGAAGPGEALLAFLYGGIKPQGAGDILLSSGDGDSIELKKQEGRIGKGIKSTSVRALEQLFYGKDPGIGQRNISLADARGEGRETIYQDIRVPLPEDIANGLSLEDKTQTIFSKDQLEKIAGDIRKEFPEFKHNFWNFKKKKWNKLPNPSSEVAANKLKSTSTSVLADMSVPEFLDEYSGVSFGKKKVEFNSELPKGSVSDVIDTIPGSSPRQKIANLIGVWHLKHYMTHIEPFKWLLVYKPDGTAASVRYDTIINTPAFELITLMAKKHLFFGIRADDQGFHIEVHNNEEF